MRVKNFDVRAALLKSAKEEFLAHGFKNASLRTICKKAKLTTGAFYSNFDSKEDLFSTLVDGTISDFHLMYDAVFKRELADITSGEDNEITSINFIRKHKDEFKLLFDCSSGTKYEDFKEKLINVLFMNSYQAFFDQYAERKVDSSLVRIILKMKFTEYMELVYGGYKEEDVKELVIALNTYTEGGFKELTGYLKKQEQNKNKEPNIIKEPNINKEQNINKKRKARA